MKDYTNETPIFSESLRVTETSDPAHADNINMASIQVFQNTLFNRNSIEKVKKGMGDKEEYNADDVYQAGDYCQYQGILYKCVQDTTGEWNPECWKQTNAMDEISDINTPTFEDYSGEGAEVPGAREAIANIRSKKGLTSIMSNIKAALMGLVTLGEIRGLLVNNGLCTEAGKFFLDAAYGKNLQDQLTKLNSDFVSLENYRLTQGFINGVIQMQINSLNDPGNANGLNFHVNLQTGEYRVSYQKDNVWMGHGALVLKDDLASSKILYVGRVGPFFTQNKRAGTQETQILQLPKKGQRNVYTIATLHATGVSADYVDARTVNNGVESVNITPVLLRDISSDNYNVYYNVVVFSD